MGLRYLKGFYGVQLRIQVKGEGGVSESFLMDCGLNEFRKLE